MKTFALVMFGSAVCLAQQVSLGGRTIEGTLQGSDGTPLTGGNVYLQRLQPYPATSRMTQRRATSGAAGAFRFEGLAQGRYSLCVQMPISDWLNPCEWGKWPEPFSIPAEPRATKVTLVMLKAAAVQIQVDDPGQLMPLHEGKTAGAHILLGTANDAFAFVPALVKNRSAGGRTFEVAIPFDVPVKLVVNSNRTRAARVGEGQKLGRRSDEASCR